MNEARPIAGGAAIAALSGARFFDGVPADILSSLAAEAEFIDVAAGETLFHEGDDSSDIYVIRSGAVAILRRMSDGITARVGEIFAGETVGEMAMLTGDPRTATAVTLRDSEFVKLSREAVGSLVARDPEVALAIARVLARRLAKMRGVARPTARPRVFAILPHVDLPQPRVDDFIARLGAALGAWGSVAQITRADADRPRAWMQQCEARNEHTLFIGRGGDAEWSAFCARQADLVLLLADAGAAPSRSPGWSEQRAPHSLHELQRELVLLSPDGVERRGAGAWRDAVDHDFHHHVVDDGDVARVARLITRRATAIVLSGGGARGFAHLGVVDALIEAGASIDIFGGSSMGAIIAAAYAGGWPRELVHEKLRQSFVRRRPLSDPTLPVVSLFRGRKVEWLLTQAFADIHIEDLRRPYFCVTSCLTRAAPMAHRAGLLRRWLQASVSIPGVLPPVVEGGLVHVDGGIMDNLPIDAATAMLRGPVIGVDVSGDEHFDHVHPPAHPFWRRLVGAEPGVPSIMETLWRVGTVGSVSTTKRDQDHAALIIRPPVGLLGLLDWKNFDRAVALGYEHTKRLLAERPELIAGLRDAQPVAATSALHH
ncbi:patatin-like phospholipase family protein [Terrarubrum flagellatum]|uniref:patatin-like phospholipase family protein n=1 Tax=Terrirubrum flagellatum TaxID=2895980 RepID=UPI0031453CD7